MQYRTFGRTGLKVSEIGFGAWGIGGTSYGAIEKKEALRALAKAEDLGCNFIDTAGEEPYGASELILGEFLKGRRDHWIVATKYSGQSAGLTSQVEDQLNRLGTDYIDFYQLHWAPRANQHHLYDEMAALKMAGKLRYIGVSLYTANDIDYVIDNTDIDGFQLKLSLLDPLPFLNKLDRIRERQPALVIRSCLKEGFLSGKYQRGVSFPDPHDQRSQWSQKKIKKTLASAERFQFLEEEASSLIQAAAAYVLTYPETSTLLIGTKTEAAAESNFSQLPGGSLSNEAMAAVEKVQRQLALLGYRNLLKNAADKVLARLRR